LFKLESWTEILVQPEDGIGSDCSTCPKPNPAATLVLRIVFEDFKIISLKILEKKTHVQVIQLHLTHLQTTIRKRMNKHEHRTLIESFCNKTKNKVANFRARKRQQNVLTSKARKQRWQEKLIEKLTSKSKTNKTTRLKT
jgi:hypothetical protein